MNIISNPVHNQLKKICYTADRSTTKKSGTKTRNGEKHMKLTILGTGNATVSECYNTCYAISDEGKHFLVDAGGGNRILKVLKDTGIDMNDIHDIFVTHEHVDHVLGIIWLVRMIGQRMNQGKYEGDLRITAMRSWQRRFRQSQI